MKSRILASVAPAAALALLLAAPGAQATDDRLAKIEASGELRVCHAEDNPWTYRDPATGNWLGFTAISPRTSRPSSEWSWSTSTPPGRRSFRA